MMPAPKGYRPTMYRQSNGYMISRWSEHFGMAYLDGPFQYAAARAIMGAYAKERKAKPKEVSV